VLVEKSLESAVCDIYRMNDNIVATGILEKVADDYIAVTATGNIPPIKPQTLVKVAIHQEHSQNLVVVGLVADASERFVKVVKLQDFRQFNKREYFRLNVMINSRIQLKDRNGILTETIIPIKVRDLSLKGVFFVAKDDSLLPGDKLDVILPLSESYTYACTVRRKVDYYRSIGYGCSFDELTNKQEDCLCSYLFDQQRKEIMRFKDQK